VFEREVRRLPSGSSSQQQTDAGAWVRVPDAHLKLYDIQPESSERILHLALEHGAVRLLSVPSLNGCWYRGHSDTTAAWLSSSTGSHRNG